MREIKFRAWDGRRMTLSGIAFSNSTGLMTVPAEDILMQYTGLKDKNGTEIYEGDILQHITTGESGEIKYGDGRFYCDQLNLSAYSLLNINNSRVIGNIHENKELLND